MPGPDFEVKDDYSGAKLDRPGLDRVRAMLDQRAVEAVIVYASDRLTRNLAHLLLLREQMAVSGAELHYCTRDKSENSPEGQMTENIEGVFNEYWRAKIAEGSMRGRNKKAKTGQCVLGGRPPFGYRVEKSRTIIHALEAAVVRQVFAWYTYGEDSLPPSRSCRLRAASTTARCTRRAAGSGPQPRCSICSAAKCTPAWPTTARRARGSGPMGGGPT